MTKHDGRTTHPLYRTWQNMITRCENPRDHHYKNYGARGISVCSLWRHDFWSFINDMGPRPDGCSLDRLNNDGDYEPNNCRWALPSEQARNKQSARYVEIDGKRVHVAELSAQTGIDPKTLYSRNKKGWPIDNLLNPEPQWNNSESVKKAVQAHTEKKRAQTHCKRGHPLSGDNLYVNSGRRVCRRCSRAWDRYLYYHRQRPFSDFL